MIQKVGDVTHNLAFNTECVGYAAATDLLTNVYFNDDTDEYVVNGKTYGGCSEIDPDGIWLVKTHEEAITETQAS